MSKIKKLKYNVGDVVKIVERKKYRSRKMTFFDFMEDSLPKNRTIKITKKYSSDDGYESKNWGPKEIPDRWSFDDSFIARCVKRAKK
jgi:hypothetical protein